MPPPLARRFVERDGTRGRLLFANQASRFDGWNGRHMIAFADAVRALKLPDEMAVGGGAFVFADVLRAVTRAGPRATLAALLGVVLFVVVVVGRKRHVVATLASVVAGTTLMIACAALLGLKVNFLDFVALPITLGISVDYAVNVVARERDGGPRRLAPCAGDDRRRGGAVLVDHDRRLRIAAAVGERRHPLVRRGRDPRRGDLFAGGADPGARAAGVDGAARADPRVRVDLGVCSDASVDVALAAGLKARNRIDRVASGQRPHESMLPRSPATID